MQNTELAMYVKEKCGILNSVTDSSAAASTTAEEHALPIFILDLPNNQVFAYGAFEESRSRLGPNTPDAFDAEKLRAFVRSCRVDHTTQPRKTRNMTSSAGVKSPTQGSTTSAINRR